MLLESDIATDKFSKIAEKYVQLINTGVCPSEILVILQNSTDKKNFSELILNETKVNYLEDLKIYSFFGLVYNTVSDNWAFLENTLKDKNTSILPNLVGLEVSQFILKDIINSHEVKGYNSKKSLLHQLFRRYSLIVQNNLSDDEINKRSEILGESFNEDASFIIKNLISKTLFFRSFDYIRQTLIFNYIYKNTPYFKNIKYLFVDDVDEMPPVLTEFLAFLKPQLKDYIIVFDNLGSTRCGYLSADLSCKDELKKIFPDTITELKSDNKNAECIFHNILEDKNNKIDNLISFSFSKRAEMIDSLIKKINFLIEQGVNYSDITIISPIIDDVLKLSLIEKIPSANIQILSGSQKLIDNFIVRASLNILKLGINLPINQFDLRVILSDFLNIPFKNCKKIVSSYKRSKTLKPIDIGVYTEQYQKLLDTIDYIKTSSQSLSEKLFYIYKNLTNYIETDKISKFDFFLKQIRDFEKVFSDKEINSRTEDIINQIENSIISENPYKTLVIQKEDLIISTPQKIIDNKIKTKYQFWLDITSPEWQKSDTGPLYNAWVFQKSWNKKTYTIEDEIYFSTQKTARMFRKLMLCTLEVFAYSSLFDSQGVENYNNISLGTQIEEKQQEKTKFKIIPRDDQKPVLEYKRGRMAIAAVPGAGKTTILLALILKLLENKIPAENIYVLTYMESAARNFKDRIIKSTTQKTKLPNISTIHGLALRILKENANYERLNLNPDFDICDDSLKSKIINSVSKGLDKDTLEDFTRAISVLKLSCISKEYLEDILANPLKYNLHPKVNRFLRFFKDYQTLLRDNNLIDYDDILTLSVKLLEENKDVREYYQNICQVVIEDEAQDSSSVQQKLIELLSGKYNNLIRCGDVNQAITTTFTNADVEGFLNFINTSDKVSMDFSQRCTPQVLDLANKLVNFGNKLIPNSFYKIYMKPVEGKNPISENAIYSNVFETNSEEKKYILSQIKSIMKKTPDATIGILLRSNYQVIAWDNMINNAGYKTITRSDSLAHKSIFRTIFAILKFLVKPFDNKVVSQTYRTLYEEGFYKNDLSPEIENFPTDFISSDVDDIENTELSIFHWDMNYWLSMSNMPSNDLVTKIGLYYYYTEIEKSNVYLVSTLVARLNTKNDLEDLVSKLSALAKKSSLSGFKFFSEEDTSEVQTGKIQIMTLHKSKGDEFDYVFVPELSEKSLSLDISQMALKSSTTFMENVKALNPEYKKKTELELKEFTLKENLRLLYVAITRAKKKLYITSSQKAKFYGKVQQTQPSIIFEDLV